MQLEAHRAIEAHEILLPGAMTLLFGLAGAASPQPTLASSTAAVEVAAAGVAGSSPHPAVAVVETSVGADCSDGSSPQPLDEVIGALSAGVSNEAGVELPQPSVLVTAAG